MLIKIRSFVTKLRNREFNHNTVQVADAIYGITMGRDSASQQISLKLDEVGDEMLGRNG